MRDITDVEKRHWKVDQMENGFYRRTQAGIEMLSVIVALLGVAVVLSVGHPFSIPQFIISALLVCAGVIFSTMTVEVLPDSVQWWFTFGALRQRVAISEIQFAISDRVTLLNGLGVRTNGRDWLWTVGGNSIVSLELRNGKKISLGSAESQKLALLINEFIALR